MANELGTFKIIGANNGADLKFKPSDLETYNELSYLTSPARDNLFSLNSESITHKYIPKASFTIPLLSETDYRIFIQAVNAPSFKVSYFDCEINQQVERTMYCTSSSLSDIRHKGTSVLGVFGVKVEFVSVYAYIDYADLKSSSYALETARNVIMARFYFKNTAQITINSITAANVSPTSDFQSGGKVSLMSKIYIGSRIYLLGTSFGTNDIFGNEYKGMILTDSKSSDTISSSNDYEFSSSPMFIINASGSGKVFLRFDYRCGEYATRALVSYSGGTTADFTSSNNLMTIDVKEGNNAVMLKAWNKPGRYARITTVSTSVVVEFKTTDYIKDFSFGTLATDETGKAQYGFKQTNGSIEIYDKEGIISEMGEDGYLSGNESVEIFLYPETKSAADDDDKIAVFNATKYDYVDSSYNKDISITLTDIFNSLNTYKVYEKANTAKGSTGSNIYQFMMSLVAKATSMQGNLYIKPKSSSSMSNLYITDYSSTIYQFLDDYGKINMIYFYSDGLGDIIGIEGE